MPEPEQPKRPASWTRVGAIIGAIAAVLAIISQYLTGEKVPIPDVPDITPVEARFGWNQQESESDDAATIRASLPDFQIVGATESSEGKRVVLWQASRLVLGKHLPTFRQEVGDCVSMGAANAVNYLQCVQLAAGDATEFHPAYQPWIYGTSRVQIGGGRLTGDGSVGVWAAQAVKKYGVLRADIEGVPPYGGSIARQWGKRPGPPQKWFEHAAPHVVETFSRVKTYAEVRDAIANGYPVTIASDVGFEGGSYQADGKLFLRPKGKWPHQMCLIGVDDSGQTKGCYCVNSWGEAAHPKPIGDEPRGGFWIDSKTIDRIVIQGDSYALSSFAGFPAQKIDWNVIGAKWRGKGDVVRENARVAATILGR